MSEQITLDMKAEPAPKKPTVKKDLNKKEVRAVISGEKSVANVVKPAAEHNSRGRGRSNAEKRESYRKYNENKKKAVELESRNYNHLILFPASDVDTNKDKFYNMGGNSAIIYVHEIGPRIKRSPALRIDMDHGKDKFYSGICSIQDLAALETKLAGIGIKRDEKVHRGYEDFVFFKLHREYPQTEIREMLKQEQKRLDTLNKVLYAKVLYPDIHRLILDLERIIPSKVKNMDATYRGIVGVKMIDTLMELMKLYTQMAHGDMDEYEAAKRMLIELDIVLAELSMMTELKLWEVSACMRVGEIAAKAQQLIKGKIINKRIETDEANR